MSRSNPFTRSANCAVDDTFGESYRVVREVYDNLEDILTVAQNIEAVQGSASNTRRSILEINGVTGILGATSAISLPEDVTAASILDFNVLILGDDDALYSGAEGYFSSKIEDGFLKVTLAIDAPATLATAIVRATIYYKD